MTVAAVSFVSFLDHFPPLLFRFREHLTSCSDLFYFFCFFPWRGRGRPGKVFSRLLALAAICGLFFPRF